MSSQFATLAEAVKEFPRATRLFLGITIATLLGVFVPIVCLNIFGVWSNAYSAFGDHLFVGIPCTLGNLLGFAVKRIWPCVMAFLFLLAMIQFVRLVKAKPMDDWLSAYPAFTRTVGGLLLDALFFNWYAKQSGLLTSSKSKSAI